MNEENNSKKLDISSILNYKGSKFGSNRVGSPSMNSTKHNYMSPQPGGSRLGKIANSTFTQMSPDTMSAFGTGQASSMIEQEMKAIEKIK